MTPSVHILATCRNSKLWRATTLVFDSIRKGFPTAEIFVTGNGLLTEEAERIKALADKCGAGFQNDINGTVHQKWISKLVRESDQPFIICDTDIQFHASLEDVGWNGPLMGAYTPQFHCPFTGTVTHSRLHTSLLFIDPEAIRAAQEALCTRLNPDNPFGTGIDLISPLNYVLNVNHVIYFHDTCSQAFHVCGGNRFSQTELDRYDHLGFGTYSDLVNERVPGAMARQKQLLDNPEMIRGHRQRMEAWYDSNAA